MYGKCKYTVRYKGVLDLRYTFFFFLSFLIKWVTGVNGVENVGYCTRATVRVVVLSVF